MMDSRNFAIMQGHPTRVVSLRTFCCFVGFFTCHCKFLEVFTNMNLRMRGEGMGEGAKSYDGEKANPPAPGIPPAPPWRH
jgi:hypothetical protein